ncbi:hypothetical protein BDDG_12935 [Blastomyces dermatitidis ATCC 18188]|uniref:Uncharacterized protein n=1 Tax=Ajellomyces dermatitidis (strain ATCC 18188 / CBS 674.68) TaxID=653446 RepID=A0A0J9ETZ5_AJEDA|nr:hypothetical protein BDDG_12935 [Blastomyces dermatitidis ATCC 18188]
MTWGKYRRSSSRSSLGGCTGTRAPITATGAAVHVPAAIAGTHQASNSRHGPVGDVAAVSASAAAAAAAYCVPRYASACP